jgi:hypothetical protein
MSAIKTTLQLAAVTTLMLAAVVACGKKDDLGKVAAEKAGETTTTSAGIAAAKASCNMLTELGTCNEYRAGSSFGVEKSLCENFHGKFSNAGCSSEGQIGSCLMSEGEVKRYYGSKRAGDHALSVEEAKGDCESDVVNGVFTVDPNAAAANVVAADAPKPAVKAAGALRKK